MRGLGQGDQRYSTMSDYNFKTPPGFTLVFEDNFDYTGPDQQPDPANWTYDLGDGSSSPAGGLG